MNSYKKHHVHRIKDLNDLYFEVLFQKNDLTFAPGSTITLYNKREFPIFIASGIQEAWCRIILNKNIYSFIYDMNKSNAINNKSIKINVDVINELPTLLTEHAPNFIITTEMISPFFSYVSTYPTVKCNVCYLGENKISEDWIKSNHLLVNIKEFNSLNNIYVLGNREILMDKAKSFIYNCKCSYLL